MNHPKRRRRGPALAVAECRDYMPRAKWDLKVHDLIENLSGIDAY
jgi:hypothetical protein